MTKKQQSATDWVAQKAAQYVQLASYCGIFAVRNSSKLLGPHWFDNDAQCTQTFEYVLSDKTPGDDILKFKDRLMLFIGQLSHKLATELPNDSNKFYISVENTNIFGNTASFNYTKPAQIFNFFKMTLWSALESSADVSLRIKWSQQIPFDATPELKEEVQSLSDEIQRDIDHWHAAAIGFELRLDTSTGIPQRVITSKWDEAVSGSFRILPEAEQDPILDVNSRAKLFVREVLVPSFVKWRDAGYEVKVANLAEKVNPLIPALRAHGDYEKVLQATTAASLADEVMNKNFPRRVQFCVEKK